MVQDAVEKQVFADCTDRGTTAAVGGFLPFAETGSGDKIAPEAAIFRGAGSHRDEERDPRL
jgi:hypothetical protein